MTSREQIQLNKFYKCFEDWKAKTQRQHAIFDKFVKEDKQWKTNLTTQLFPLLKEHDEKIIISAWRKNFFQGAVGIIAFFVSLGLFVNYVLHPLLVALRGGK